MRKSFLKVDQTLLDGGLDEVAEMKRKNPPNKSPLLKLLTQSAPGGNPNAKSGEEELMLDSIGCTANVVLIDYAKKKLFVANAGDSRCVMGSAGGKCTPLSFDHKPENQTEIDRIHHCGSQIVEGRVDGNLNLTRALGDLKHKQKSEFTPEEQAITANPDTFEYDIPADIDFVFMGCDGVWERKSNEEMVAWIYEKLKVTKDMKEICTDLLKNECLSPDHQQTGK